MTAAVKDVMALVEETAPSCLAESWDNVGLLVGDEQAPVSTVWLALEVTGPLIEAAAQSGVDMLLTHHPVIFSPIKRVTASDTTGGLVLRLARQGIHALCAHTNLDAAQGASTIAWPKRWAFGKSVRCRACPADGWAFYPARWSRAKRRIGLRSD